MKFKFNGRISDEFGIILTKITDVSSGVAREVIKGAKTKYRALSNSWGTKYNEDLSFNLVVIKDPSAKQSEMRFTSSDIKALNAWLTSPQYPQSLKILDSDYYTEDIEYFAVISNVTTEDEGYIYELIFTVECNAPYGLSKEYTHGITSTSDTTTSYTIYNTSDEHENYIYPKIQITPTAQGTITIKSTTDNNSLSFSATKDTVIYIDSEKRKFTDSAGTLMTFDNLGIEDVDKIYLPRLLYGKNILKFKGDAEIVITYREPRKVGVFN